MDARTDLATISRRAALGVMGAGGVGFVLFGPRRASDAPSGRVVIDYWEKWTGHEGRAMRRIVDEFNATQDRIWVRYFSMSAIDQKALISIAGGDPPDLVGLWSYSLPAFAESRALLSIAELDAEFGAGIARDFAGRYGVADFRIRRDHYAAPAWGLMHHAGFFGGIVNTCSTMGLYYNRSAFAEAGLDPDRPPRTIAELDDYAERLTTTKADGSIERSGFIHREPGWWNWVWGYHFGGSVYDAPSETATAAAPANVRAYEWVQSYPKKYGFQRFAAFQSGFGGYSSAQQAFVGGKVAMCYHGPFLANVIESYNSGLDYAAVPFPVVEELYDPARPIGLLESDMLCIPAGCPHPRETYEFVVFTQLRRNVEALAMVHAKPTPLSVASDAFVAGNPNRSIAVHNELVRSERAFITPPTRAWPQYKSEFDAQIGTMWELVKPASGVLGEIERRAQSAIDKVVLRREQRYGKGQGQESKPQASARGPGGSGAP